MSTINGRLDLAANFSVYHFSIERIIARLTIPYETSAASNIYKLLSITGDEDDVIRMMLADILEAHHVTSADDISLERLGALLNLSRKAGESDTAYRARIIAAVPGLIGGGTIAQLKKTVLGVITGITESDITVEDGYTTPTHGVGDPSHYAHFRILIDSKGNPFDAGLLFDELDKARGAGITMDFGGPVFRESQTSVDRFFSGFGGLYKESQDSNDAFRFDMTKDAFDESQRQRDPESLGPINQHYVEFSYAGSLNLVYVKPEAQMSANFTVA